jgi:hypothetical protein
MKHVSETTVASAVFSAAAESAAAPPSAGALGSPTPQGIDGAERAYREGRFDEAAALYRNRLDASDSGSVGATLFNLGNCALQTDRPASALWHYRRAALRLPDEPVIAANMRLAERRLGLGAGVSDVDSARTEVMIGTVPARPPLAAIPDAWLLGAAVLLQAAGLLVAFRMRGKLRLLLGAVLIAAGAFAALPLWSRLERAAHPTAIVLVPETPLLAEPRETSAVVLRVREGESLQIIDKSDTWAHVTHGRDRGWIRLRALGVID